MNCFTPPLSRKNLLESILIALVLFAVFFSCEDSNVKIDAIEISYSKAVGAIESSENLDKLVSLSTVDNQIVKSFLEGILSAEDVHNVYAMMDRVEFEGTEEAQMVFHAELKDRYPTSGLDQYFTSVYSTSQLLLKEFSQVDVPSEVLKDVLQEKVSSMILNITSFQKSDCGNCAIAYDECKRTAAAVFGLEFGVMNIPAMTCLGTLGLTGAGLAPCFWLYGGSAVTIGIKWLGSYAICRGTLRRCLERHDCPPLQGGGGNTDLESIMRH